MKLHNDYSYYKQRILTINSLISVNNMETKIRKKDDKSKERVRAYRERVKANPVKEAELKLVDRDRKRVEREKEKAVPKSEHEQLKATAKATARKREYRAKLKLLAKPAAPPSAPMTPSTVRNKIKNAVKRAKRRLIVKLPQPSTRSGVVDDPSAPSTLLQISSPGSEQNVSSILWQVLTPNAKKKARNSLKSIASSTPGLGKDLRDTIGLNISNPIQMSAPVQSRIERKVEEFFNLDIVSRACPDKRQQSNGIPVRFALGHFKTLYSQFTASWEECSLSTFMRSIPHYVKKPRASDWGTSLCSTCLNPELKVEAFYHNKFWAEMVDLEEIMKSEEELSNLLKRIDETGEEKKEESITFHEWTKVPNPLSPKGCKISRKMPRALKMGEFVKQLGAEIKAMKEHLHRAHMQYRAFKEARVEAQNDPAVITVQIDWSENAKLCQAREEKSAYYFSTQLSIHAMYAWWDEDKQNSFGVLSDCLKHQAPAGVTSLEIVLGLNQYFYNIFKLYF